jgi:hypothetical protein
VICKAEVGRGFLDVGAFTLEMTNEPRLNFLPPASNGSSAASNDAFLNL